LDTSSIKIALVHDWLTGMRGGEKVLETLIDLFPQADLFTLLHNHGSVSEKIESLSIYTSFIDRLPLKRKHYAYYLPLFPTAIELFDLKKYDLILSTSHCVAKGVRTPPTAIHISYIHSPMRYVWDMYEDYFSADKLNFISRKLIPLWANYLRMWDVTSSNRVDAFIANSKHVAKRIRKYYRREAKIIHPPVDTELHQLSDQPGAYYLIVSALVPYKRIELAVKTFNQLRKPLLIIGEGPEEGRLKKLAAENITFVNWQPSETLHKYYSECLALIFPGEEDFGITPVEAQACGKPVIAFARGGALETVVGFDGTNEHKSSGVFFDQQNESALRAAVEQFEKLNLNQVFIRENSERFNTTRFKRELKVFVEKQFPDLEHYDFSSL
jgi:glycosyltransferase involved in cell wall biosynthesis